MSVSIKYKGAEIASASTNVTKTIKTSGKYCEADILVENTPDGGDAPVINSLSVTANGTYTAPSGVDGYSPVTVNVPQGITPTGNINITDTNVTDVTNYATATIVDADLVAENIKKDVNILGIVGSFEGGGDVLQESGQVSYHTGAPTKAFAVPISDDSYTHYYLLAKATKSWKLVDGEWVEQNDLDFSGTESQGTGTANVLDFYFEVVYGGTDALSYKNLGGATITDTTQQTAQAVAKYLYTSQNTTGKSVVSNIRKENGFLKLTSNWNLCNAAVGLTFEYSVVGWN